MSVISKLLRLGALLQDNLQMGEFFSSINIYISIGLHKSLKIIIDSLHTYSVHSQDCDKSLMFVFHLGKKRHCLPVHSFLIVVFCLPAPQPIGQSSV